MKKKLIVIGLRNLWKRFLIQKNNYFILLKNQLRYQKTEPLLNYDKYLDKFIENVKNEFKIKSKEKRFEMNDDDCDALLFGIINDKIMNYQTYTLNCGINIERKKTKKINLYEKFVFKIQLIGIWFKSILMAFNTAILISYNKYRDKKSFIKEVKNNFKSDFYRYNKNKKFFGDYSSIDTINSNDKKRLDAFAENMFYGKKLNEKINIVNN